MTGKKQKINLKMDEDNSISFALSIEGYSSDASLTSKPSVRFVMTEQRGAGFVLPAKFENGEVSVDIPSSNLYVEGCEYNGKLEVFLGNRYFTPAELLIQFEKPLKVEAKIKGAVLEESSLPEPVVATVRRNPVQKSSPVQNTPVQTKPSTKPTTKPVSEKKLIDVEDELQMLLEEEEKLKKLLEAKRLAAKNKKPSPENLFKMQIKKMLKESLD